MPQEGDIIAGSNPPSGRLFLQQYCRCGRWHPVMIVRCRTGERKLIMLDVIDYDGDPCNGYAWIPHVRR